MRLGNDLPGLGKKSEVIKPYLFSPVDGDWVFWLEKFNILEFITAFIDPGNRRIEYPRGAPLDKDELCF